LVQLAKSTTDAILDVAEQLMKTHGWSAVSYADLAVRVGIRSASIHHHFPTKADLGSALFERYARAFLIQLDDVKASLPDSAKQLGAYLQLVSEAMGDGTSMCLCARLAADYQNLPDAMRAQVTVFNEANIAWIADVLREGSVSGAFIPIDDAAAEAELVYSESQGAQLLARSFVDVRRFDTVAERMQARLRPAHH
jgi:TetR/AcrR family transcriptional repressor of nem operon